MVDNIGQGALGGKVRISHAGAGEVKTTQTNRSSHTHSPLHNCVIANDSPVHDGALSPSSTEDQTSPDQLRERKEAVKQQYEF